LGTEFRYDLVIYSTTGAIPDPHADLLLSTRVQVPASGRHATPGPERDSPAQLLQQTVARDSSSGCHVVLADSPSRALRNTDAWESSAGRHVTWPSATSGLSSGRLMAVLTDIRHIWS
jgi:hypothetical protein